MLSKNHVLYITLTTLFCTLIILSNLMTVKLFAISFPRTMALPAGLITYPLTFVISDLVTELYGKSKAKMMVYMGFAMNLVALLIIQLSSLLPAYESKNQEIFEAAFGMNTIVIFGSLLAYLTSQTIDVYIFSWIKEKTKDKYLWLRNNVSTLLSQLIDSVIVDLIIFYVGFRFPLSEVYLIIAVSYFYKALFSVASTLLFYASLYLAKQFLKEEVPVC